MTNNNNIFQFSIYNLQFVIAALLLLASCRDDEYVTYMQDNIVGPTTDSKVNGMYLLCEGNMGSNKATIDYVDLSNADGNIHYQRNIYASRNPNTVKELGDVGNDIQIYGGQMWIVVNCSNKVEVCQGSSCKRIGQVNIPNCRYVAFSDGYAYISSYAGPIQTSENTQIGRVYKVDTKTLQIASYVDVGYQPEELVVLGNKLYVANSGGYRAPDYDRTVSVIDLASFKEERKIDVAVNLHSIRADKYGQLWVSSQGDYNTIKPKLYYLTRDTNGNMQVAGSFDVAASNMDIVGDTLYYIGTSWNNQTSSNTIRMGLIDVKKLKEIENTLFESAEAKGITLPHGIKVNPYTKDFYLMDAKNYVSSGELLHFKADGTFEWRQWTGDIPSRAVFVTDGNATDDTPDVPDDSGNSPYIAAVDEYVPAPGQFVNTIPLYEEGDDATAMARKCTEAIANNKGGMVTLGGYGGYITFHFDHPVKNVEGEYDLMIKGNAFDGNSEPGIVMVSQDLNGNGLPDDEWYELSGSADTDCPDKVAYNYEITYTYSAMQDVPWTDSKGRSGTIERNSFHQQEYFPKWLTTEPLKFKGTLLPSNGHLSNGTWILDAFRYGYADNHPNSNTDGCSFNIDWAVDCNTRQAKKLNHIDFVRVYNAMNQQLSGIGETSTEITGATDLHN